MIWSLIEKIVFHVLTWGFGLFKRELSDRMFTDFMQFVKFGIIGVSNTVLSYLLYAMTLLSLQRADILPGKAYLVAQIIGFVLSVLWSFYWNNKFVFAAKNKSVRATLFRLAKTYVSYSFSGLFLSTVLLILWVQVFGISEFIAPMLNIFISVPLNFLINKHWAFK